MVLLIGKIFSFFLFLLLYEECTYFLPYATFVVNKRLYKTPVWYSENIPVIMPSVNHEKIFSIGLVRKSHIFPIHLNR